MVRLEKLIWEQALNNKTLGRGRNVSSASKWWNNSKQITFQIAASKFQSGLVGKVFGFLEPLYAYLSYQWNRDIAISRGLALEDFELFKDRYQRREYLFEMVNRQSCHPATRESWGKRRARVYRIERAFRGFVAPDWLQEEAKERLHSECVLQKRMWDNWMYHNYRSEFTPTVRPSIIPRYHPIEMATFIGLFRNKAWDRLFFNEAYYDNYTQQDLQDSNNIFAQYDLETESGKSAFEAALNRYIKMYPGMIVKEGQQYDFQAYYIKHAIQTKSNLQSFDPLKVQQVKAIQQEFIQSLKKLVQPQKELIDPVQGQLKLGSKLPSWIKTQKYAKALI